MTTTITKAQFLDLYDQDKLDLSTLVSTSIAIVVKKKFESGDPPTTKGETLIVNIP